MASVIRPFPAPAWACLGLFALALGLLPRQAQAEDSTPIRPVDEATGAGTQVQLDVMIVEVQPGLTHPFISSLRKPTNAPVSAAGKGLPSHVHGKILESPHERRAFRGFLSALKKGGLAKVLAEPRLVTLSGRPASFFSGTERVVPVQDDKGRVGTQTEKIGTSLNFLPLVLANGKIRAEVEPELSRLDPFSGVTINGTFVPGLITDRINTTVELEDGQTFVLYGLTEHHIEASVTRVPVLGEVPFLANFFSHKSIKETETERILLFTPTIVRPDATPKQHEKASEDGATPEVRASLRRLERQLKHLQRQVDALHREYSSRPAADSATSGWR